MTETVNPATAPGGALPTVAFVGAGRAGTALALALRRAGYTIAAVASRTPAHAARLADAVGARHVATPLAAVRSADVTFLTVPDGVVTRIAATVAASGQPLPGRALVHCSGSQPAAALGAARVATAAVGAVHPLQALADAQSGLSLEGTFFAVEADEPLRSRLERMVTDLGGIPFAAPAGDRALYHAAAVLAGNAPLALLARAVRLLETAGVDPEVASGALAGLLEGAARNARRLGARAALTGPVVRNDAHTVERHLEALRGDSHAAALYRHLARETLAVVGVTGREDVAEMLAPAGASGGRRPNRRQRPGGAPAVPARLGSASA